MKTVGFDIDGTLTFWEGGSRLRRIVPVFLLKLLVFSFPRVRVLKLLRGFKKEGKSIVLVSNRPEALRTITVFWLRLWSIPFDRLVLAGNIDSKMQAIIGSQADIFYDNKPKNVERLISLGITSKLI